MFKALCLIICLTVSTVSSADQYQTNSQFKKTLLENFARYEASYRNYAYQQYAQRSGNGGTLNPIAPGTIRNVLMAPITSKTNLRPVTINGREYVLYNGRYLPVDND